MIALATFAMPKPAEPQQKQNVFAQHVKDAFDVFELKPYPRLKLMREDGALARNEMARAVLYESGREDMWVRKALFGSPNIARILQHEAAHLKAWREHGTDINMHGPEWQRTCRAYATAPGACNVFY